MTMLPIEMIEKIFADQVRFLDIMLQETRKRNKLLKETLDSTSYAKLIGLGTPYEKCVYSLREVRREMSMYLSVIRDKIMREQKSSSQHQQKKRRPPYRPPKNPS